MVIAKLMVAEIAALEGAHSSNRLSFLSLDQPPQHVSQINPAIRY